jgi:uncharacterized protein (TIGR03067 family)
MKRCAVVLVVLMSVTARAAEDQDAAEKEMDRLQGTWKLVTVEINGKEERLGASQTLAITKNKMVVKTPDRSEETLCKLDPTKKLKTIDIVHEGKQDPERKGTMLGIYRLEGETLTICTNAIGSDPRPTAFKTKPADGLTLLVYQRDKQRDKR